MNYLYNFLFFINELSIDFMLSFHCYIDNKEQV
jgi:hypothetical protein